MRTVGGIPIIGWIGALAVGVVGFLWFKKQSAASSTGTAAKPGQTQPFTQAQEVQDFQVFSALTGAQQASDLNFLTEVAGLFSGGSSTASGGGTTGGGGGGGSSVPSPPPTGTTPPATTPAPTAATGSPVTYGAPGQSATTTFSSAPPAGTGYVWTGSQWVLDTGQGVGYVPA
jgi:hypothetical protein